MASDAPLIGRLREATEAMMRAEASLRATESRYHTLFESIDEGFCVIEVLFENDRPVDYQFLEANPAFLEQTGLTEAIGRTMRELAPEHESHWFDIYGRVAKTGEPIRFEAPAAALNRYFDVYAFRVDDPEKNHVAILFNDISKRKRADETLHDEQIRALKEVERRVTDRTVERDDLRRRLDLAEEEERRRLSRELHDEAGQHLTALALGLHALSDIAPPGSEIDRRAEQLIALAETLSRELHAVAVRLRPRALDDFGLEAAISAYAEEWSKQNGIAVDVHAGAHNERLPDLVESGLYRIVQEALTNVAKHSGATRASVVVERRNGHVSAIVEDNGHGIDAVAEGNTESAFGIGLLGMRERASLLGGSIDLESSPGHGTSVFVRLPIAKPFLGGGGRTAMTDPLRVVLADDHAIVREGLRSLVNAQPDMCVVGEAADGESAWKTACDLVPDVLVMDFSMPILNGAEAAERIRHDCPCVKILALTVHEERLYLKQLLRAGASGYVLKRSATAELVRAVRIIADGGIYIDPSIAGSLVEDYLDPGHSAPDMSHDNLSDREREVLVSIARGYSNKEIAASLGISVKTVETYKARMAEKLGLHTRVDIVRYVAAQGLIRDSATD